MPATKTITTAADASNYIYAQGRTQAGQTETDLANAFTLSYTTDAAFTKSVDFMRIIGVSGDRLFAAAAGLTSWRGSSL